MKRKTSSVPTRIYKYGLPLGPVPEDRAIVDGQLWAALNYKRDLTRLVLDARERYREIAAALPDVATIDARTAALDEERAGLRATIKEARAAERRTVLAHPTTRARVDAIGVEIKALRAERKAATAALRDSPELAALHEWEAAGRREKRSQTPCYWGSYLLVEQDVDRARAGTTDPRLPRADGSRRLGVQLAAAPKGSITAARGIAQGLLVADVLACADSRLRLDMTPRVRVSRTHPEGREVPHSGTLWLRVGSAGREPVWARFPIVVHRPLPEDGVIKWCWVQRRQTGSRHRWEACFVVEAQPAARPTGTGTVAVDLGGKGERGGFRVALAVGDDGEITELTVPAIARRAKRRDGEDGVMRARGAPVMRSLRDVLDHADSIRSIADRTFDEARAALITWARAADVVPEWLREELRYAAQWRSPRRLARLHRVWQRFDGDEGIYALLSEWRAQNDHLRRWECEERHRALAHRDELYRVWATMLSRKYARVVLENVNFASIARRAAPEEEPNHHATRTRSIASPGKVREEIVRAFGGKGSDRVTVLPTAGRATTCAACGGASEVEGYVTRCADCGATMDSDFARCWQLLRDAAVDTSKVESRYCDAAEMVEEMRRMARRVEEA